MTRPTVCRAISLAILGALLTGCSLFGSGDEPKPAPVGYPRSWIWSAAPAVSLGSADARTVRAWVESEQLYQDSRVSYPGFTEATAPELLKGMTGADDDSKFGGTERYLIRSIAVRGGQLRASLCADEWDEFAFAPDGAFAGAGFELTVFELVMRKGGATAASPAASLQQSLSADATPPAPGRSPYSEWLKGPQGNEFGGWVASTWDVSVTPPADCIGWFKKNHPGLSYPTGYTHDTRPNRPKSPPPPTLPGSPGW